MDQESDLAGRFVHGHTEVAGLLAHPFRVGVRRAACESDLAGFQVNKEQHVDRREPSLRPNLLGKEIRCPCNFQVRLDEGLPRHATAVRDSGKAVALKHVAHVGRRRHVAEFCQFTCDAHVAPSVVLSQFHHQRFNGFLLRRAASLLAPTGEVPFLLLHAAVPCQERFGPDDGNDVGQPVLDAHAVLDQQPTLPFGEAGSFVGNDSAEKG